MLFRLELLSLKGVVIIFMTNVQDMLVWLDQLVIALCEGT